MLSPISDEISSWSACHSFLATASQASSATAVSPRSVVIDVLGSATPASAASTADSSGGVGPLFPSQRSSQVCVAAGDRSPSPSGSVNDDAKKAAAQPPGKYLVMDLVADVWGRERRLRFYLPDVPAKMGLCWTLSFLGGFWLFLIAAITIVLVPESKWASMYAMSGIVGDPMLLATVNLLYPYGTYRNLAVQVVALIYGVLVTACVLVYTPFGYAATLLVLCIYMGLVTPCFALNAQPRLFTDEDHALERLHGSRWLSRVSSLYGLVDVPCTRLLTASGHVWADQNRLFPLIRKCVPWMRGMDALDFCQLLKYIAYMLTIVDFMSDLVVGMGMIQHDLVWPGVSILILCQVDNLSAIVAYFIRQRATLRQHACLFAASLFEVPILVMTILYGPGMTDRVTMVVAITATCSTIFIKGLAVLNSLMERLPKTKKEMTPKWPDGGSLSGSF
ncbi:unnamed protein product [Vitrella brassicaformis CCMP3155]|uniref:Uncharacterized protein n=2 Tax=Vitrella brassicaformis TaxID=1169539 RepID=A0A0G4ELF7_VITBC|nr:unnamed protein product [Vitrella brassicaformis CCMP3155]|eukprot:CEL98248.1 unnamed protein product [Vitrella brassicaformis CCMP3155]